jgi:hypothetical protein
LGKGAKIAIGCAAVLLLGVLAASAVVFWGMWVAKRKLGEFAEPMERLSKYERKANANPFTAPADGSMQEDRLKIFLDIRHKVYDYVLAHKAEFDALAKKKEADFSSVAKGLGIFGEAHMVRAKAQAEFGMSDSEYVYMVTTVTRSLVAANFARQNQGHQMGEMASERSAEALRQQEKQLEEQPAGSETDPQRAASALAT